MIEYSNFVNKRPETRGGSSWLSFPSLGGPAKKNDGEQGGLSGTFEFKLGYRF